MQNTDKKTALAVIYGGKSGEHEVSIRSAVSVIDALDTEMYDIIPVRIAKDGRWHVAAPDATTLAPDSERMLVPTPGNNAFFDRRGNAQEHVDVVLPLIHGTGGEDGTLQGLLELAELPYAGSGVLGSSVGMDKAVQKGLLAQKGLPVTEYSYFYADEWLDGREDILDRIEKALGYPNFVKPVNLGSSVGISKAHHRKELEEGIETALRYDAKIIVERAVPDAREIECAVTGNLKPTVAAMLGEVIPSNEFYDYDAKYVNDTSEIVIPAELPQQLSDRLRTMAADVYRTLETRGFARVDFLVVRGSNEVYVNEINTVPGFTSISMFPKLWHASGVSYARLLDTIIALALEEDAVKKKLSRDFSVRK